MALLVQVSPKITFSLKQQIKKKIQPQFLVEFFLHKKLK